MMFFEAIDHKYHLCNLRSWFSCVPRNTTSKKHIKINEKILRETWCLWGTTSVYATVLSVDPPPPSTQNSSHVIPHMLSKPNLIVNPNILHVRKYHGTRVKKCHRSLISCQSHPILTLRADYQYDEYIISTPEHVEGVFYTSIFHFITSCMFISWKVVVVLDYTGRTPIAKFMWPTWGLPGSCRPLMGPMLAPWTLLSAKVWPALQQ